MPLGATRLSGGRVVEESSFEGPASKGLEILSAMSFQIPQLR